MRGFYIDPSIANAHVLVCCVDTRNKGHSGLGVNCLHTVRTLRKNYIRADYRPVRGVPDIDAALASFQDPVGPQVSKTSITHCVIEAPWISTPNMTALIDRWPDVHFIVRVHSQIAFLQVEAGAVQLIREQLQLQEIRSNFNMSANSRRLTHYLRTAYAADCIYLPNLYDMDRAIRDPGTPHDHRLLRIGSFGAIRLLKNHISAAAAALLIAQRRGSDLEFYISSNREEHGKGVVQAIRNLYANVPYATLKETGWQDWPVFRRTVANMDLCMQPSMSETFNIVTADAAAEGIPSVVSACIEWCPNYWHADVDDVDDIARVGSQLLSDAHASRDGVNALKSYQNQAIHIWKNYLSGQPMIPNFNAAFLNDLG